MYFRRIIYLAYYLKNLKFNQFIKFLNYSRRQTDHSGIYLLFDVIVSSLKYNISLLEYFQFHFYEISDHEERNKFAGTGTMYEYQNKMNPPKARNILEDKGLFLKKYAPFVKRKFIIHPKMERDFSNIDSILNNPSGKIVIKNTGGQVGAEVKVLSTANLDPKKLLQKLEDLNFNLIEEFVVQHPDINRLSDSGLNTVRVITQIDGAKVEIIGARLRISVNSEVDNMAAGNLACPIELSTGKISGPGVYSDITKPHEFRHPISKVEFIGYQIPYWHELLEMVRKAALWDTSNKSIGWDIGISSDGPELIEGNHNWCKLLWQLPVKKGLKHMLNA